jgi:flagellar motor component MotA
MSSTSSGKKYLIIAGRILLLLIVVIGALQSGTPASYFDPYGFLFVLVGGAALLTISFPGAEIWRAFRHAAGGSGNDAELSRSARLWEAAGRGFWILGGLRSVLSIILGFAAMATMEFASISALIPILIRSLLSTFYGSLLAVICFVPCWKLTGKLQSRLPAPGAEQSHKPELSGRYGLRFGTVIGYVLFLAALVSTLRVPFFSLSMLWPVFRPSLLVVLGGTLAVMLFLRGDNTRLTPSTAFAGMGLIGSLMGFIQMLHGMTLAPPQGVAQVAGAVAFVLSSCFIALLGMAVVGAPLEERAIQRGRVSALSAFSRVSWYVFPLLSLIFMVLVFFSIITPLPA